MYYHTIIYLIVSTLLAGKNKPDAFGLVGLSETLKPSEHAVTFDMGKRIKSIITGNLCICIAIFLTIQFYYDCRTYTYGKLVKVKIVSIGEARSQVVQIKYQNQAHSFMGKSGLTNDMIGSMYEVYHYEGHFIRTDDVYWFWLNILFVIVLFMMGASFLLNPYD